MPQHPNQRKQVKHIVIDTHLETNADGTVEKLTRTTVVSKLPDGTIEEKDDVQITPRYPKSKAAVTNVRWTPKTGGLEITHPKSTYQSSGPVPSASIPEGPPIVVQAVQAKPKRDPDPEKAYMNDVLEWHNIYRDQHDTPPLVIDEKLSKAAQKRANQIRDAGKVNFTDTTLGENVYITHNADRMENGRWAVDRWYSMIKFVDWDKVEQTERKHGKNKSESSAEQATQVIWKGSKKLGLALAKGANKDGPFLVLVAFYEPQGNALGEYKENVLPVGKHVQFNASVAEFQFPN